MDETVVVRAEGDQTNNIRVSFDVEITVPKGASITCRGKNLDVDLSDINGRVDVDSDRSGVRVQNMGGKVVIDTRSSDLIKAIDLRPATDDEIKAIGAVPGYASPVGLKKSPGLLVVVDTLVLHSPNLVAGANREGYHLRNVNHGRDFTADLTGDIIAVREGDPCPECGTPLLASRAVEVGNIFQLGTRYTDALGCLFTDDQGNKKPVVMGSYGIGIGRLLGCLAEEFHDERGLTLPAVVAPYRVQMVVIPGKSDQVLPTALNLATSLEREGSDVLVDDRAETPGVKFNDADLIGAPVRVTVSERSLGQGGVEVKGRLEASPVLVPLEQALYDIHQRKG
jgi:prolyl-tRNA synthetase